jgi:hypothetical protein
VTARNQITNATFSTTTGPSGGYSLEVPTGTYTVTFPDGGIITPAVFTNILINGANRKVDFDRSVQRATTLPENFITVSADAGASPEVRVLDAETGFEWLTLTPYSPNFRGGVRVATGDVNRDGVQDIITAPGAGGGPHIMVFDGRSGNILHSFFAYDPRFSGGVFVAAGDVNGDGRADIITAPGAGGGPHVRVFSGLDRQVLTEFFAYSPNYQGGVHVAAGNVDGAGFADIITGTDFGGGPHIRVFSGQTGQQVAGAIGSFFAYNPAFVGGVWVASADLDLDGRADIVTGPGFSGGPHVRVFSGRTGAEINGFFAYNPGFGGGVRVGVSDVDDNGRPDILTAPGAGGGPHVRAFQGTEPVPLSGGASNFMAFSTTFTGGVHLAGGRNQTLSFIQTTPNIWANVFADVELSFAIEDPTVEARLLGVVREHCDGSTMIQPSRMHTNEDQVNSPPLSFDALTNDETSVDGDPWDGSALDEMFADKLLLADLLSA